MSTDDQSDVSSSNIARVTIRPPPFWKVNPNLWFAQLEAQFNIAGITADSTKFYHVLSAMESDILNTVSDIVLHPPAVDKYGTLKKRLVELHSESQESKIRRLLQGLELGDQRPSQLLTRMRNLAGEAVGEPLLKSLWLSRLPANTQGILAALNEDLSQLATVADKISDLAAPSINATSVNRSEPTQLEELADLKEQISELRSIIHRRGRPHENWTSREPNHRRRSNSRTRVRRYKEPADGQCFFHTNFGSKARKCTAPCSFRNPEN